MLFSANLVVQFHNQKGFIVRTKYSVDPDQLADLDPHCFL